MVGIIGAMDEEVDVLKEQMEVACIEEQASLAFYVGKLFGQQAVVVRCGIGKVNAAICTQIMIDKFNVDMVINTGVAGALSHTLNIGDIVISKDTLQYDMDATGFGYKLGEIPRMDESCFVADACLVALAQKASESIDTETNVFVERIVTGDQFISDSDKKEALIKTFGGFCTEMEGASIGQVCYLNKMPYVVIRSISDKADQSAEMNYAEFVEVAVHNSTKMIEGMLHLL
ncbi:5'-methylthioadenosine/adenosylhomocysteine nucleosidase [Vallitalea pronyensis]|uniref:adenosylhomocysteine nucleosidase n=1 Tax=Vallitalea pronyensis TaxID=1348613 RepID=A0A8J8SJI7_9FIRM|nr:5'-methylthioadenosine/adenosylhomocysteine nucleosidase [Vallitalea pronyensis]QUI25574.1 5'-methylthioadenosine/adenosylhomocysteine nucleosidase [Vallitalea pronyensis]